MFAHLIEVPAGSWDDWLTGERLEGEDLEASCGKVGDRRSGWPHRHRAAPGRGA
jgi:hypothetical protein